MRVLFMCTANSCRSILSEAMFNHLAPDGFEAVSSGSFPKGQVLPRSLATLQQAGICIDGLSSKGNDAFEGNLPDIVITVCDKAAGESCPVYFGQAVKAHWGLEDPSDVVGDEAAVDAAFRATLARIEQRCKAFLALPFNTLGRDELKRDDHKPRILLLYGSTRERSFSRLLVEEAARLLEHFGAETRIFNPSGLPLPDDAPAAHPKVQELRELMQWSEGQVWCSPERHGAMSAVFKAQIDWVPLELGAVRPTQGKTLAVMQVCGGSQSFNVVNQLRVLGRWMRMFTIPNQSSVPKAFTEFDEAGRMKPSAYYDRVVDVMEELVKFTLLLRDRQAFLVDRYSERKETADQLMARMISIELHAAQRDELQTIENLMQFYTYDFSEWVPLKLGEHGFFNILPLSDYWRQPATEAFLIRVDGELAGFVTVDDEIHVPDARFNIGYLFVSRGFRGQG
eukprot:gene6893-6744_t